MAEPIFSPADEARLADHGIPLREAQRQIDVLRRPPHYANLVRPCTVGDGIERLDEARQGELAARSDATRRGRRLKFVPASGAASRMFRDLLHFWQGSGRGRSWSEVRAAATDGGADGVLARFCDELPRFAFHDELQAILGADPAAAAGDGRYGDVLDALLGEGGLGYAARPKGLLRFHRYRGRPPRTAFEEHLVEAAAYARGPGGECRLHFTVSPEHRDGFWALLQEVRERYEQRFETRYEVEFSAQKPSTDTLALDGEGLPFRTPEGELLFRPGGHGALIENLAELDADLVFIKNIDNVQPDHARSPVVLWKKVLAGRLLELREAVFGHWRALRDGADGERLDRALAFVREKLHVEPSAERVATAEARREFLLDRLHRPLRVCGVVPNTGEPGGGPFWERGADGTLSLQIVEGAQIDPDSEAQQAVLGASTHFSPVDLVCGLEDADGRRFDLSRFIDPDAVIFADKSAFGRDLKALERPGLWNGAMAGWNTVFVEVPLFTFTPVKTVLDLLRDEHQPPA